MSTDSLSLRDVLQVGVSTAEWHRRIGRLEKKLCPMCGSGEWILGMSCWDCGWESEPRPEEPSDA